MKLVLVTNIPAPYRIPIYNLIAQKLGENFLVIFCASIEANRQWTLPDMTFHYIYLKENSYAKNDGYNFVHNNPDVFKALKTFNPDVVITTGFNPTHLYAWLYTIVFRKQHIPMTDGWLYSESHLSWLHRLVRYIVFKTSHAFIGASKNSLALYESYGISKNKLFQSHLCIENKKFSNQISFQDRPYHVMFSGQFHEIKLPLFFAEVAGQLAKKINNFKVLILGDGPLKNDFFQKLDMYNVNYDYAGYVDQSHLPGYYGSSKLFLFTTRLDAWGLVVNEALASGTPVISTPYAGVVNDLLIDGFNGRIIENNINFWIMTVFNILADEQLWMKLSSNAVVSVQNFNFDAAATGIIQATHLNYSYV